MKIQSLLYVPSFFQLLDCDSSLVNTNGLTMGLCLRFNIVRIFLSSLRKHSSALNDGWAVSNRKYAINNNWAISWDYGTYHLQTCMLSHPVGLDVWFLVGPFVYFHTSCVNSEGPGNTAWMCRLAWAFTGRLCDKYHNLKNWLKYAINNNLLEGQYCWHNRVIRSFIKNTVLLVYKDHPWESGKLGLCSRGLYSVYFQTSITKQKSIWMNFIFLTFLPI